MANRGKIPTPKTQREILNSQIEPYNPPPGSPGFSETGNPNTSNALNRGNQVSFRDDNTKPFSLGIKDIDEAIMYYMEEVIQPTVIQNGTVQQVPFIYGAPERWKQIQKDGYYRDKNGKIMLPLITFKRSNIEKVRNVANKLDANNPHNVSIFQKQYSVNNAYDNFNTLNNKIPQKVNYAVVVPDYVNLTYDFIVATYYVEQLNKIVEAINYASDSYWGNPERYQFRARIDNFATPVQIEQKGERSVKATFTLKLYGYLVPDTINKELSTIRKMNTPTQINFNMETVQNIDQLNNQSQKDNSRLSIQSNNNYTDFSSKSK
ncbi:MAG: hypothetical protein GY936_17790 [Ignavibacteriae bacterium]|nr:hypothetical protein [Candidatus Scalindua sp.]MCP5064296.1 hypothetical protein [Ignavibacteriota bacterium]